MVHRDTCPLVNFLVVENMVPVTGETNKERDRGQVGWHQFQRRGAGQPEAGKPSSYGTPGNP